MNQGFVRVELRKCPAFDSHELLWVRAYIVSKSHGANGKFKDTCQNKVRYRDIALVHVLAVLKLHDLMRCAFP